MGLEIRLKAGGAITYSPTAMELIGRLRRNKYSRASDAHPRVLCKGGIPEMPTAWDFHSRWQKRKPRESLGASRTRRRSPNACGYYTLPANLIVVVEVAKLSQNRLVPNPIHKRPQLPRARGMP